MKKTFFLICTFILINNFLSNAQVKFKVQSGASYIEHFSIGIKVGFSDKRSLSLLYGSDFFIKPNDFSSVMIQYDRFLNKVKFKSITPKIGLKGGYSIYTNEYYQWELISVVPFLGLNYPINKKIDIAIDLGMAISRELSIKRISYGDIGNYKQYLPEFKIAVFFEI